MNGPSKKPPEQTWSRSPHWDYHYHEPIPNSDKFVRADFYEHAKDALREIAEWADSGDIPTDPCALMDYVRNVYRSLP